jgi:hypothetical protein
MRLRNEIPLIHELSPTLASQLSVDSATISHHYRAFLQGVPRTPDCRWCPSSLESVLPQPREVSVRGYGPGRLPPAPIDMSCEKPGLGKMNWRAKTQASLMAEAAHDTHTANTVWNWRIQQRP